MTDETKARVDRLLARLTAVGSRLVVVDVGDDIVAWSALRDAEHHVTCIERAITRLEHGREPL